MTDSHPSETGLLREVKFSFVYHLTLSLLQVHLHLIFSGTSAGERYLLVTSTDKKEKASLRGAATVQDRCWKYSQEERTPSTQQCEHGVN